MSDNKHILEECGLTDQDFEKIKSYSAELMALRWTISTLEQIADPRVVRDGIAQRDIAQNSLNSIKGLLHPNDN